MFADVLQSGRVPFSSRNRVLEYGSHTTLMRVRGWGGAVCVLAADMRSSTVEDRIGAAAASRHPHRT